MTLTLFRTTCWKQVICNHKTVQFAWWMPRLGHFRDHTRIITAAVTILLYRHVPLTRGRCHYHLVQRNPDQSPDYGCLELNLAVNKLIRPMKELILWSDQWHTHQRLTAVYIGYKSTATSDFKSPLNSRKKKQTNIRLLLLERKDTATRMQCVQVGIQ